MATIPVDAVVKLGGSLLAWPELPARLNNVLQQNFCGQRIAFLVGGGKTADLVREWDQLHVIGEEPAHQLAIESLSLNERLLCKLVPQFVRVTSIGDLRRSLDAGVVPVISAVDFLSHVEASALVPELPHSWDVTSDSIALAVARLLRSKRLTLFKSCDADSINSLEDLSRAGLVDRHFPILYSALSENQRPVIEWLNLRAKRPRQIRLHSDDAHSTQCEAVGESSRRPLS